MPKSARLLFHRPSEGFVQFVLEAICKHDFLAILVLVMPLQFQPMPLRHVTGPDLRRISDPDHVPQIFHQFDKPLAVAGGFHAHQCRPRLLLVPLLRLSRAMHQLPLPSLSSFRIHPSHLLPEAAAKAGKPGAVIGHAAFVPAQMAAGELAGRAIPEVPRLLREESGEAKVPFTGKGGQRVGQRVLTSVKAAQGHNPDLSVGMEAVRDAAAENPDYLTKLASKLDYPAMKYEKGLSPEAKVNSFIKQAAGNIEWLHNQVPDNIREISKESVKALLES